MGSLKDWNEALVSHFLTRSTSRILFNVTPEVITNIHNKEGFEKSRNDSIEDFLMALCNEKTGYGEEIDKKFDCKTTEKRSNGWPVKPENIFWNAYELRVMFQYGNRESVPPEKQYFKFPDFVPPWTSHLALTILATSMNVGYQPENSRYPMIADLFKQKMDINDEDYSKLHKRIIDEYTRKFFGKVSTYSSGYYWRAPRIIKYYYKDYDNWKTPWSTLYHWAEEQSIYPGTFRKRDGWIMDPVTTHSKFRKDDRNAMLGALNIFDTGVSPSDHALDQVIIQNKSNFRNSNKADITNGKLIALREYALGLWENNQNEIRSYSPISGSSPNPSIDKDISGISVFQIMPYLYIDETRNTQDRVQCFMVRLHHTGGPSPRIGQIISIKGHDFQFHNTKHATSLTPLTLNGNLDLIKNKEVIEHKEKEHVHHIYSFNTSIDVYTKTSSPMVLTQDSNNMYEWMRDDEVSKGFRIVKGMGFGYNDELMTDICGFKIGLDYNYQRIRKSKVKEIDRTKIKLDGGSKISGGTDRRYHFNSPPHFVLTRGHASDVRFLKINPKEDEDGNRYLKNEPTQMQERGKTVWKLSLKDDIFPDDSDSSVVKIFYELEKMGSDRVLNEETFTVVKGVDHWQLHPIADIDSNNKIPESKFNESIFTNHDLCTPISEKERAAKEKEAKAKAEAEEAAAKAEAKAKKEAEAAQNEAKKEAEKKNKEEAKEAEAAEAEAKVKKESEEAQLAEEQAIQAEEAAIRKAEEEAKLAEEQAIQAEEAARIKAEEEARLAEKEKPIHIDRLNVKTTTTQRQVYNDSRCSSCGIPLVERKSTIFPCPGCNLSIGRCPRCRSNGAKYHCLGCDYIGP